MNSFSLLSRIPGRPTLALLLFISIMLLGTQIATLAHGADHPFHQHNELCDSLSAFQHSPALPVQASTIAVMIALALSATRWQAQVLTCTPSTQNSRAPPHLSTPR